MGTIYKHSYVRGALCTSYVIAKYGKGVSNVFSERFSDKANDVMSRSKIEADQLGRIYRGTEHILLAMAHEPQHNVARIFANLELTYDDILEAVKQLAKEDESNAGGHIPYTPRVKKVLEKAYRRGLTREQGYVSTEDLLYAMIEVSDCKAVAVLAHLGITPDMVRLELDEVLKGDVHEAKSEAKDTNDQPQPAGEMPDIASMMQKRPTSALAAYSVDLTDLAAKGKLDVVIGREEELLRIMQVLARRQKNNPLILGDAGVGKTAIVEALAQRIAEGDVPLALRGKKIFSLDLAAMIAGAKFRGEFEERLKNVLAEVKKAENVILFIDEMHTVIGAGSAEGSIDAASILKPGLSRSEFQIIGATTQEEYAKYIEKDTALERRFQPISLEQPDEEKALKILQGLRSRYEEFHNVTYTDEALESAVRLSMRYIQDRSLPDKAIDVIDEAGARRRVQSDFAPEEARTLDSLALSARKSRESAHSSHSFEDAARFKEQEEAFIEQRDKFEKAWFADRKEERRDITEHDIAHIVSGMCGVPVSSLTEHQAQKLLRAEHNLQKRVIGQDEAVKAVSRSLRRSRSPLKDARRPAGSFIFLGPSGVGKTELAKSLAEFLFGTEDALITFDMSEFMESHTVSKFIGAPPGYKGYGEGGLLTKAVRRRPYSVILFDEIEKAHPDIFNVFLQILDEGRLTDSAGRKVDFSNTTIIMTSNVGASEIAKSKPMGFVASESTQLDDKSVKSSVMTQLKKQFRPEFLNRLDDIIVFKSLNREELRQIIDLMVDDIRKRLTSTGVDICLTDEAKDFVASKGYDSVYGARPLKRALQTYVEDPLSEEFLVGAWSAGDTIEVFLNEGKIAFKKAESAQAIKCDTFVGV